ncbi:alpha/beta hydrolase [Belnapia moabensis]|uniref:alpha/beta hydrolase n=1 Tax=Belnapia moabensis TaxID=365533 RepID=UPI000693536E|nr:alpha/beta hydrolase [Belnapia moabensis]
MRFRLLLILLLGLAPPLRAEPIEAQYRSIFSASALGTPGPSLGLVSNFTLVYRGLMGHAAFALAREASGRSAWGYANAAPTPEQAQAAALANCRRVLGPVQAECRILASDAGLAGGPSIPLAQGGIGPFRWAPMLLRRGPQAARGVVIWSHGYGGPERDYRTAPTPGFVSILNDAGWDVLRFDRNPAEDALYTSLPRLTDGLQAVRAAGYRRIILGGQSRGGWQSIMAASAHPGLVDAVIATAPAAHGEASRANNLASGLEDFRRLLAGLPPGGPRLAVAIFDGDDFDPDPEARARLLEEAAQRRPAPVLALWPAGSQPTPIRGHGGGTDWRFTTLYGACLLTLADAPEAAAPRGLRRTPCGGG